MQTPAATADLKASVKAVLAAAGIAATDKDGGLAGEAEKILAKWFLGTRKVTYRMSCRFDEAAKAVHFREVVLEKSSGLPPPTLSVEVTTTSGWTRSGSRTDTSPKGGGTVDYGQTRNAVEKAVNDAGWTFDFEGGRMP
ncbi:MAG: hypothetical protein JSR72_02695 [Proteobacteria bacterium]|nr:hypothetical protein [Pseudomonadota bacterium]